MPTPAVAPTALTASELQRYSRHLLIPEVGLAGQQKLRAAAVLLIGAGGLGSPAAMYLAAAGVGRIGLVDDDRVDASNLQRQVIHGTPQVGQRKVDSARQRMLEINPHIEVQALAQRFDSATALEIAQGYDLIIDGSDNFPTRYLVNDVCLKLGIPFVYGSIYRFDGQVSVFAAPGGPCYRCLFPQPPEPGTVPSCAEGGVLGSLPGIIGSLQASEAIKLLLGIGAPLVGRLLMFNALEMQTDTVRLRKNPACPVCSLPPDSIHLIDYQAFCGLPAESNHEVAMQNPNEISPAELAQQRADGAALTVIDVREPHELAIARLEGTLDIPMMQIPARLAELDPAASYVVMCHSGARSQRVVEYLQAAGFADVRNLVGGINAWAEQVDPDLPVY
ncbi:MAG: molybdopterin-synthase adenylyltransferase MoeB [Anaerolineales bacterium]|jgi:adenylyltransferase/sulfurtransferase|nr:molybdopterin-synthase adenylyltransferase MoeB [Anaerolineales bacterium]MBX3005791.1 molybdopterin-synthase adenylyltransferase MoeB [Anaerolineales bacterium]MCW5887257.1 molybdopterin-synthase adenylyltransferase MoeB [Anaerolineales bacterium]